MTRRKRLCLLLAVLTLLLALSACGAQSKLVLATTGMEPTLNLTLPDTITLPDKGWDTVYKCYVDKAYSMALAAALLDMDADTMQTQLAGRLSYDAQTGYIQYYTPTEELTRGDLSEFPTDAQLEQTVRERLKKFEPELADTSRIVFSSATYETNVSSKTVDVTPEVNGRMVYGKYHISVSFDRDGNVTALTQQYAPLKEGGTKTVRLADAKTVQARLDAHEFSANIAQQLTGCTITGFEQAYYMNAGFNTEGDYSLHRKICGARFVGRYVRSVARRRQAADVEHGHLERGALDGAGVQHLDVAAALQPPFEGHARAHVPERGLARARAPRDARQVVAAAVVSVHGQHQVADVAAHRRCAQVRRLAERAAEQDEIAVIRLVTGRDVVRKDRDDELCASASSRSRTTTFTRSIVPESRWVSSGKVKKRSCLFSCDSAGGAASVPQSSA